MQFQPTPPSPLAFLLPAALALTVGTGVVVLVLDNLPRVLAAFLAIPGTH